MFKRINKNAIIEAVHSEESMEKQITECLKYRKAYGFVLIIMAVPLLLMIFSLKENTDPTNVFILAILFIANGISASENNSRLELLKAIKALNESNNKSQSSQ